MKRRDFCKLMAVGAAGVLAGSPFWPRPVEAKTSRAWWAWFCDQAPPRPPAFRVCDSHFHFFDFVQHTDGATALIEAMDRNGVDHIMFSGMPLVKKWDRDAHQAPVYYLDNNGRTYWYSATDMMVARTLLTKVPEKERSRFHPFICGFNGTDLYAVEHIERMLDMYDGLWHGIGEVFGHRDDLSNMTFGEAPTGDHPALMKIYQLAGRQDLPVVVHNNVSSQGRPTELLYWPEIERAARENPLTRFIWAHAGLSRHFEDIDQSRYAARLGTLLQKYPNLHIDLSWMVFERYIVPDPGTGPPQAWLDLIGSFPTRFLIGSDSIGRFSLDALTCADGKRDPRLMNYAFNIRKYYVLLERLRPATARLVARENFLDILPARVRKAMGREG